MSKTKNEDGSANGREIYKYLNFCMYECQKPKGCNFELKNNKSEYNEEYMAHDDKYIMLNNNDHMMPSEILFFRYIL